MPPQRPQGLPGAGPWLLELPTQAECQSLGKTLWGQPGTTRGQSWRRLSWGPCTRQEAQKRDSALELQEGSSIERQISPQLGQYSTSWTCMFSTVLWGMRHRHWTRIWAQRFTLPYSFFYFSYSLRRDREEFREVSEAGRCRPRELIPSRGG